MKYQCIDDCNFVDKWMFIFSNQICCDRVKETVDMLHYLIGVFCLVEVKVLCILMRICDLRTKRIIVKFKLYEIFSYFAPNHRIRNENDRMNCFKNAQFLDKPKDTKLYAFIDWIYHHHLIKNLIIRFWPHINPYVCVTSFDETDTTLHTP